MINVMSAMYQWSGNELQCIIIVSTAWQNTGHDVVECNCTLKLVAPGSFYVRGKHIKHLNIQTLHSLLVSSFIRRRLMKVCMSSGVNMIYLRIHQELILIINKRREKMY